MSKARIMSYVAASTLAIFKSIMLVVTLRISSEEASSCADTAISFSVWLLVYAIVGLVACTIWILSTCLDLTLSGDPKEACIFGNPYQMWGALIFGIPYILFSLVWHICGWFVLFLGNAPCKEIEPLAWALGLTNLIILYPYLFLFCCIWNCLYDDGDEPSKE